MLRALRLLERTYSLSEFNPTQVKPCKIWAMCVRRYLVHFWNKLRMILKCIWCTSRLKKYLRLIYRRIWSRKCLMEERKLCPGFERWMISDDYRQNPMGLGPFVRLQRKYIKIDLHKHRCSKLNTQILHTAFSVCHCFGKYAWDISKKGKYGWTYIGKLINDSTKRN